jgi:Tfp pilus assembly protein PilV
MNKGQSLFEVVVSLAISALIIVAVVSLVSNSIRNATFSKNKTLAAKYAQEATEWLRGQRDSNIEVFSNYVLTPKWCLKTLSWTINGSCGTNDVITNTAFLREANFTTTLAGGKDFIQADVVVFWNDSQGYHEVRSATSFADWRNR